MKIQDLLNEKTTTVMTVLERMCKEIYNDLPYTIKFSDIYEIYNPFNKSFCNEIYQIDEKYGKLCEYITNWVKIVLVCDFSGSNTAAFFKTRDSHLDGYVYIYLGNILGHIEDGKTYTKQEILLSPNFEPILLHELRHIMQSNEFRKYYVSDRYNNSNTVDDIYRKDPIEIDASFFEVLNRFKNEPTVESFVEKVMSMLIRLKDLSEKWKEHYNRKAIVFYQTYNKEQKEFVSIHEKYKQHKDNIISKINNFDGLYDLRELGYTGDTFLLDDKFKKLFKLAIVRLIEKTNISEQYKHYATWYVSLMYEKDPKVLSYKSLCRMMDVDIDSTIKYLKDNEVLGYNYKNMKKSLTNLKKMINKT